MKNFARKHPFWLLIITLALSLLVCGAVSVATNGFTDFNPYDRNEANLFTVGEDGNLLEKLSTDALPKGLEVTMDEKGIVKIKGDTSDEETYSTVVLSKEITLEAGKTYTFTTGKKGINKDATEQGKGIDVILYGALDSYFADNGGLKEDGTFTIAEDATDLTFTLKVTIYPGEHNTTLYPVLVEGDSAVSFYD